MYNLRKLCSAVTALGPVFYFQHSTMKAQTCATLCSVLLFIGAPWGQPRAVLAENIPTIDGSLLDRTINVLRFLINDKTRDQQGAQEAAEVPIVHLLLGICSLYSTFIDTYKGIHATFILL